MQHKEGAFSPFGAVAQSGERLRGTQEVAGSIPVSSTTSSIVSRHEDFQQNSFWRPAYRSCCHNNCDLAFFMDSGEDYRTHFLAYIVFERYPNDRRSDIPK